MPTFHLVRVVPNLPRPLTTLRELAYNLRWTWDPLTSNLFQRLDPVRWESSGHNPVRVLAEVDQERLNAAAADPGFLTQLERAQTSLENYLARTSDSSVRALGGARVAYFSLEFGLATCLPIYSGGLGILAGDTLKTGSDLALPYVGVGIHYNRGYFRQYLNSDGWQQEEFVDVDYAHLPISPELREDGKPLTISVDLPDRPVVAQVWKVRVGGVPLYLLDTNVAQNRPEDRLISDRLYGGNGETRIQQEILLGVGGIRLLRALGIENAICHMNEGHSAFLGLERVRLLMRENGLSFDEARELAASGNVFTTHTPVPAGIDLFEHGLMDRYFGNYWPELGLNREQFLGLGRQNPNDSNEPFSMAVLGIRMANIVNGVSQLHGQVSRLMWHGLWPALPEGEVPIDSVTNGVHHRSWIDVELAGLLDRYAGTGWFERPTIPENFSAVYRIPDEELWRAHGRSRELLVGFARDRLSSQLRAVGASAAQIEEARQVLDPEALTIGFARRFARYKRSTLLFREVDRLARLLNDRERPVQIIIAGKAHPQDEPAKTLIREINHLIRRPEFRHRVVFIENYDITVAQHLVRGCDVWLNTPLRPQEASGTSGMKAAINGALNLSILDGWWAEAYKPGLGWAIGGKEEYPSVEAQDAVESQLLYDMLEQEVIPTFYDRSRGVPRRWVEMMKNSIVGLAPRFNTDRMVLDYLDRSYLPAAARMRLLAADNQRRARDLAAWKRTIGTRWSDVAIERVEATDVGELPVGAQLEVRAVVRLGTILPDEVTVEAYYGPVDGQRQVNQGMTTSLSCAEAKGNGYYTYAGNVPLVETGMIGYAVRVVPRHEDLHSADEAHLMRWS